MSQLNQFTAGSNEATDIKRLAGGGDSVSNTNPKFFEYDAGTIKIYGATSGIITLTGQAAAGTFNLVLPNSAGSAGQLLSTDGSGNLSWAPVSLPSGPLLFSQQANFGPTQALSFNSNLVWNLNTQQVAKVTLTGNVGSVTPQNMQDGGEYILRVIQDGTGSRTISWGSTFKWPGAAQPTLSTAAGAIDIFTFICDGSLMYGVGSKGFG